MSDCNHEELNIVAIRPYGFSIFCDNIVCEKVFKFEEYKVVPKTLLTARNQQIVDLEKQVKLMQDVVEHFAKLLNDNPDLASELCVCESGYWGDMYCPICDERSPLWQRGKELKALNRELSKKRSRPVNIGLIKELVESCGALKEASQRCKLHSQKAIGLINTTNMNPGEKNIFKGLIDYVSTSLEWYR